MTIFNVFEDEWYPVISLSEVVTDYRGYETVELSAEEIVRVEAAFEEFGAVQHLLWKRMVSYRRSKCLPDYVVEQDLDPSDPYVKYAEYVDYFDR